MTDRYLVEPDIGFINEVIGLGGEDLKKCYQCATCAVACPISPDNKPFPRKEMIAASWGLKDKLVGNADIWLCHNCGDCSTLCPRGAKPGDVLAAVRSYAVQEYAQPKKLANMVNDPKKLPQLLAIPAVLFIVIGLILKMFGIDWLNFAPGGDEIAQAKFIHSTLVDIVMIPTFFFAVGVFALGLKRFMADIHKDALATGKTDKEKIDPKGFIEALVRTIPTILKHNKFSECGENTERATSHMMVFYGFIGLFIVTNIFFVVMYGFGIHGPYSQLNPVKWLANIAGVALIVGASLMIKDRLAKKDQVSSYKDWFIVVLALALGVTGMLTQMTRLGGAAGLSYTIYFLHLICIWTLFAYLPFSKFAHIVYRTVAMAYTEYTGRK
ncbi:Quinone interacting membrane bound oxidoreductase, subunit C [Desulfonema limicola]|uniref:Quinone interacting membrane bound oxidoreductase, subunit C n=1 Tax=Desulfonema limicola TaxID=45656 RepID=A0A975GFR0_9BACT|nr:quinone-interacting membrane-bound oxidoreductase complex subunit QmoC [Desulfonema limicola]QTA79425.1 Quinone interacting membrane bound oxidoreductase, subunit C [Desulfonema limicola]